MRKRVLLVDGDEGVLEALGGALRPHFSITYARDGHEALCAGPAGFDVIVTDLDMPVLDGETLKDELDALRIGVPVIFLSAAEDLPLRARHRKAFGFVPKPFDIDEVAHVVAQAIRKAASREEVTAVGPQPPRR